MDDARILLLARREGEGKEGKGKSDYHFTSYRGTATAPVCNIDIDTAVLS